MWVLLSRTARRFLLLSVAIPLAPKVIRAIRGQVEQRGGPTWATRWLSHGEALIEGFGKTRRGHARR